MNARHVQLTKDHQRKKITLEQLRLECARWTADEINAVEIKPYPAKPREMEHGNILPEDRNSPSFFAHPQINNYFTLKRQVYWENKATLDWLKECRGVLLKHDEIDRVNRIDMKLKEGGGDGKGSVYGGE